MVRGNLTWREAFKEAAVAPWLELSIEAVTNKLSSRKWTEREVSTAHDDIGKILVDVGMVDRVDVAAANQGWLPVEDTVDELLIGHKENAPIELAWTHDGWGPMNLQALVLRSFGASAS
jgi:hypothetical protein